MDQSMNKESFTEKLIIEREEGSNPALQIATFLKTVSDEDRMIQKFDQPLTWRLIYIGDKEAGPCETVIRMTGIISTLSLPPVHQHIGKAQYARQSLALTGYGSARFQKIVDEIMSICQLFERSFPADTLESWKCSFLPGTTHPVVDVTNRYFVDKRHVQSEEIIEFSKDIDPRGILKKAGGSQYVHTSENEVKYYKKMMVEDEVKYVTIPPVEFRVGDSVEIQLSFIAITISRSRYKVLLVLRAITLLDTTLSKLNTEKSIHTSANTLIRKHVGYDDKEIQSKKPSTQ